MRVSWRLHDPEDATVTDLVFDVNPNQQDPTDPVGLTQSTGFLDAEVGTYRAGDIRGAAPDWTFGGMTRDPAFLPLLQSWLDRGNPVHLSDHLGQTFLVYLQSITADRVPTHNRHRAKYQVRALMLEQVS